MNAERVSSHPPTKMATSTLLGDAELFKLVIAVISVAERRDKIRHRDVVQLCELNENNEVGKGGERSHRMKTTRPPPPPLHDPASKFPRRVNPPRKTRATRTTHH